MGAIWVRGGDLVDGLAELVGFKLGIAVTADELSAAVARTGYGSMWPDDRDGIYHYRSEEYEELVAVVLAAFGDPDVQRGRQLPVLSVIRSLPKELEPVAMEVIPMVIEALGPAIAATPGGGVLDPRPILTTVKARYGTQGERIALQLLAEMNAQLMVSPWGRVRRREWPDLAPLRELFATEATTSPLNAFFDQRFLDYLHANFDDIDSINWRRFEALTGEYLHRAGLAVELGAGRNDDGIDVRAWLAGNPSPATPLVIVQCKREKRKIAKTVIKALAADVQWEGAVAGLLVTTGEWSPGARSTVNSRAYPVGEINRDSLRKWLASMRTPGSGGMFFDS